MPASLCEDSKISLPYEQALRRWGVYNAGKGMGMPVLSTAAQLRCTAACGCHNPPEKGGVGWQYGKCHRCHGAVHMHALARGPQRR